MKAVGSKEVAKIAANMSLSGMFHELEGRGLIKSVRDLVHLDFDTDKSNFCEFHQ